MHRFRCERLSENATVPTRGSDGAAGWDLYSAVDTVVPPMGVPTNPAHRDEKKRIQCGSRLVPTDLKIAIPHGTYGRIGPRSGLDSTTNIGTGAGVVDRDYRGNVQVLLRNFGTTPFEVKRGDRIAQLILERIDETPIECVDSIEDTERGQGGFGSTGQ